MSDVCSKCQTSNVDTAIYCKECGTKLIVPSTDNQPSQENNDKVVLIILTLVGIFTLLIVFFNYNSNDAVTETTTEAPVTEEVARPAADTTTPTAVGNSYGNDPERGFDEANNHAINNQKLTYIKPSGSYDGTSENILSVPEIRYCLAQKIKFEAIKLHIDNTSNEQIDKYNGMINDLNNGCGNFRYKEGDYTSAQADVETQRYKIEQEGIKEFFKKTKEVSIIKSTHVKSDEKNKSPLGSLYQNFKETNKGSVIDDKPIDNNIKSNCEDSQYFPQTGECK